MRQDRIHKFVGDQLSRWPMACANYRALKNVRVRELDVRFCRINVVSTTKDKKYGHAQREAAPGLYVLTHSSTKDKKKMLDKINKALNMGWRIEIVK